MEQKVQIIKDSYRNKVIHFFKKESRIVNEEAAKSHIEIPKTTICKDKK